MAKIRTDQQVVDLIAGLLGTNPEWSGAEFLEWIGDVIGTARPHPGDTTPHAYRRDFQNATGRPLPFPFDQDRS
jgi:hypothetical protein